MKFSSSNNECLASFLLVVMAGSGVAGYTLHPLVIQALMLVSSTLVLANLVKYLMDVSVDKNEDQAPDHSLGKESERLP